MKECESDARTGKTGTIVYDLSIFRISFHGVDILEGSPYN